MRLPFVRIALVAWIAGAPGISAQDPAIDSAMDLDPVVPAARLEGQFAPGLLPLWLEALDRPEVELRARAAMTIVQANERGMKGLSVAVTPLLRELRQADQHASVRLAAAKALIALDARATAADLLNAAATDLDLRELADPALARWDYKPARAIWLARLDQPPHGRGTVLAAQGLATVKETGAADRLRTILFDRDVSPVVKMEAARALGLLRTQGSEADAVRLSADKGPSGLANRVAAAALLRHHAGEAATDQLKILAKDTAPAVAGLALDRLMEIDANLVVPLVDGLLASPDAKLRAIAIETLFRQPSGAHIHKLGDRLLDPDLTIRRRARESLKSLAAKPAWRALAAREATRALAGENWRGQEQGVLLAGEIDHKAAANRIVDLLTSDRSEAVVATGWALRKLAVVQTLPAVHEYIKVRYRNILDMGPDAGQTNVAAAAFDQQISQLCQFIGQAKYVEAKPLFRQWIPLMIPNKQKGQPPVMTPLGAEARAAAFWAMGKWYDGQPDAELVRAYMARLRAVFPGDVEAPRVRTMATISLGRMKAVEGLPALRQFYLAKQPSLDLVNNACGWAIEQIMGEKMPAAGTIEKAYLDWFVMPNK